MKKTITIYELLGLVKYGKAPKKIYYDDEIWEFHNNGVYSSYWNEKDSEFQDYMESTIFDCLNENVEIIEDDGQIEKKKHYDLFDYFTGYKYGGTDKSLLHDLEMNFIHINDELCYLIDHINKIEEKINER